MGYLNKEKGFTFISMLLAFSILVMILPLISYTMKAVDVPTNIDELSVQQFFLFLQDEIRNSHEIDVRSSQLHLEQINARGSVIIKQHKDVIHRQINNTGHEIFLRDVDTVQFLKKPYGIYVSVKLLEGGNYEKVIPFY